MANNGLDDMNPDQFVLIIFVIGIMFLALIALMHVTQENNRIGRETQKINAVVGECMELGYSRDECISLLSIVDKNR